LDITNEEISAFVNEFRKKARFLVDECLGETFAEVLREFGNNVLDAKEAELIVNWTC